MQFVTRVYSLHSYLESFVISLHKEHYKWEDRLTGSLLISDDIAALLPTAVVAVRTNQPGWPFLALNIDVVVFLRGISFKWIEISKMLGVAKALYVETVKKLVYQNLKIRLWVIILFLQSSTLKPISRYIGEWLLHDIIRARGMKCTYETLRKVIHNIDPINIDWTLIEYQPIM